MLNTNFNTLNKLNSLKSLFIGVSVVVVLLGACITGTAVAQSNARVRIVHASPDVPAVDVYVDGAKVFTNTPFKKVTEYSAVKAGQHLFQIVPTGKTLVQGPVVISTTATVDAAKDYSVLTIGRLTNIAPLILADDNLLPAPGKTLVRFVHASPDSPAVDMIVPEANNLKLFSKIGFKNVGKYTPVDAGTVNLEARVAGTDVGAVELKGLLLAPRTVVTVYMFGLSTSAPALSIGVSVDAVETLVNKPILPVTGSEPMPLTSLVSIMLGMLMIAIGIGMNHTKRFSSTAPRT